MAGIKITAFAPARPIVTPTELADNEAQVAENCRIESGKLQGWPGLTSAGALDTGGAILTQYKYTDSIWLEWTTAVDVVTAQVADDQYGRVIWTRDGAVPQISDAAVISQGLGPYPAASYDLGVPPPDGVPVATLGGTPDDENDVGDTRSYLVTLVDKYGGESVPTLPSNEIVWKPGNTVNLTLPPVPAAQNREFTLKRIYRSNTASSTTEYQFIGETTSADVGPWADTVAPEYAAGVITTYDYDVPNAAMVGVVELPNGYLAGFFGNTLCFSEPGHPYAWPIVYRLATKKDIVGITAVGNTIVVATEDKSYLCVGTHPEAQSLIELDINHAGVSRRGIISTIGGAYIVTHDGLLRVTDQGAADLVTMGVFTRAQWQALVPSTMRLVAYETLVLCFYTVAAVEKAFAFSPLQPQAGIITLTQGAVAPYYHAKTDLLYVSSGATRYTFGTNYASPLSFTWRSKEFEIFSYVNLGAAQLRAETYPVTFKLISKGVTVFTKAVADDTPFRLPATYLGGDYELELSGTGKPYALLVGETFEDLRAL